MKKLYEIRAEVSYAVVVAAETEEQALEHIKAWEHAWAIGADLIGVSTPEVVDIREPSSQELNDLEDEAHEVV